MAHGEGTIFQRGDGRWVAQLTIGWTPRGTKRKRTVTCGTGRTGEAEAKRALRDMRREHLAGQTTPLDPRITVKRYTDNWLDDYATRAKPRTVTTDKGNLTKWIIPTIGDRPIKDLGAADVAKVSRSVLAAGKSPTTAHNVVSLLKRVLIDAKREGYTVPDPAILARLPEVAPNEREALTVAQAAAMLAIAGAGEWPELPSTDRTMTPERRREVRNQRDGLRVASETDVSRWVAAFLQGMRRGECLGLTWDRVDLDAGTVDVSWQLQVISPTATPPPHLEVRRLTITPEPAPSDPEPEPRDTSYCLTRPKTRAGRRVIPLVPWMVEALRDWKTRCPETPWGLVWPSAAGNPRRPEYDTLAFKALAGLAGVSKSATDQFVLHEARHTTVSILLALGVSPQVIIAIVGHSSFASTERYAHVDMGAARTALEGAAELLGISQQTPLAIDPA